MEYTLYFPTSWDQVDPANDNIDVCMTLPDGRNFTFVITTPENLKALMAAEGKPWLFPGAPMLIVERLTENVVSQLIAEVAADETMLAMYGSDL